CPGTGSRRRRRRGRGVAAPPPARLRVGAGGREQLAEAVELFARALVQAVQGDLELEAEGLEQRLGPVLEREREREVLATRAVARRPARRPWPGRRSGCGRRR